MVQNLNPQKMWLYAHVVNRFLPKSIIDLENDGSILYIGTHLGGNPYHLT